MSENHCGELPIQQHGVKLCWRSRFSLLLMRLILKTLFRRLMRGNTESITRMQLFTAAIPWPRHSRQPIGYRILGNCPGHVIGDLMAVNKPVLLWLHGGAFILPAAGDAHIAAAVKICDKIDAVGFMPDYRLAPLNPYPAALDDCEQAYLQLLEMGYRAEQIALVGDSAGGNLLFGVLQRLRNKNLPLPACALPISPATEMSRPHGLPSRSRMRRRDPLLPMKSFGHLGALYIRDHDATHPEISPLYMDCHGLPPLQFMISSNEVLADDGLLMAQRCHEAGVATECHLWHRVPHAFPVFERLFPEVAPALDTMAEFLQRHLHLNQNNPNQQSPNQG